MVLTDVLAPEDSMLTAFVICFLPSGEEPKVRVGYDEVACRFESKSKSKSTQTLRTSMCERGAESHS